jgi:20S proteasome alpha/beta subunit
VSYIAAFHCQTGIVMCADTQETVGDYKNYVEKIATVNDQSFPLAVGGAGYGPLIDAAMQEIIERARESRPKTRSALHSLIRGAIREVYENDLPTLSVPRKHRSPEILVAGKPVEEEFCIFFIRGRRILDEPKKAIIGYSTAYNLELLRRLHRESLSMQQAVMLAIHLVSQSKKLDEGVSGETRVALIVENGAWIDDVQYIQDSEKRVRDFLALTDELFFDCIDVSIPPKEFPQKLANFATRVNELRDNYLRYSAARTLSRAFHEAGYKGDPYPKLFAGAKATLRNDRTVEVSEAAPNTLEPVPVLSTEGEEKSPTLGYSDGTSELPDSLQAVMARNSKGLWEMKITNKEIC